mmetsp:Transcript_66472/g.115675  ORF Transcript_66472/g.115675 Transcript_66472/m.115675 type:complete len:103 (-) Transcript_66472:8-316(-)
MVRRPQSAEESCQNWSVFSPAQPHFGTKPARSESELPYSMSFGEQRWNLEGDLQDCMTDLAPPPACLVLKSMGSICGTKQPLRICCKSTHKWMFPKKNKIWA